nr:deoxyribodipyrimidine photo lyase [Hymenolepis microstoma]
MNQINKNRVINCGKSVAEYPFASCRIRRICGLNSFKELPNDVLERMTKPTGTKGSVVYWMNRDQRVQDNWALLFAQRIGIKFSLPLAICFSLPSSAAIQTRRHANFLLEGLAEVEQECNELNIGFHIIFETGAPKPRTGEKRKADCEPSSNGIADRKHAPLINFLKKMEARVVITDFSPLRDDLHFLETIKDRLPQDIPFYQVDAHNVIPVWFVSDKVEYAARTIRPKLHEKAKELFTDFPPIVSHPYAKQTEPVDWSRIKEFLTDRVTETVEAVEKYKGGAKAGFFQLYTFLHARLPTYEKDRNDPTKDSLSNLSPWLHFGHISPQRCLWEAEFLQKQHKASVDAFIEEAFIRRELADNFCFYNKHYDSLKGAWSWAQETLRKHSNDIRQPSYSEEKMESASTGDELWNAAQRQLLWEGKMHGFLRMYWAKKILEWHAGGPEKALKLGIYLNDKYSLDGTDPNGYVGVMWSICGIHDQGWMERPVFGKIRFMNFTGCKRKFDVAAFIKKYPPPINKHFKA